MFDDVLGVSLYASGHTRLNQVLVNPSSPGLLGVDGLLDTNDVAAGCPFGNLVDDVSSPLLNAGNLIGKRGQSATFGDAVGALSTLAFGAGIDVFLASGVADALLTLAGQVDRTTEPF
jgi:hypothetical protein